jgi:hypothetical protein
MLRVRGIHAWVCLAALQLACSGKDQTALDGKAIGANTAPLRDMSVSEASADLEQLFTYVRTLYGPYEYKEQRFGYSIAELEKTARSMLAQAPTDDGFYTAAKWFLSRFDDGHVSLLTSPDSNPVNGYEVGIMLQPVQGKALVAELFDASLAEEGISYGDEVVAVDGVSPFASLPEYRKIDGLGSDLTDQHLIYMALIRPAFAQSIRPTAPTAHVQFRSADGTEFARDLVWREARDRHVDFNFASATMPALQKDSFLAHKSLELNHFARGSLASVGATLPFFYTAPTAAVFDITPVTPNAAMIAKYGLDPSALPDIFAALYSYAGKTILLIRQSSYDFEDGPARLQYYRAIMDQYDAFADALVIDQTHNPGGYLDYCIDFARLFMAAPGQNFVEAFNTDRTWINNFRSRARAVDPTLTSEQSLSLELRASRIEAAYDAGKSISDPMPLYLDTVLPPDQSYVWTKPKLVLVDELSGSCADIFPMLIKRNGTAPLFGRHTEGLGGNVEPVGTLINSDATLYLTRGLFTTHRDDEAYPASVFIENNGTPPDVEHEITVDDFRTGFVEYMGHFSDVVASEIDGTGALTTPPPPPVATDAGPVLITPDAGPTPLPFDAGFSSPSP